MRVTLINADEAPPRPLSERNRQYRLEMDDVLDAMVPGKAARIASPPRERTSGGDEDETETNKMYGMLLAAAAARGERVDVWKGGDGFLYIRYISPARQS